MTKEEDKGDKPEKGAAEDASTTTKSDTDTATADGTETTNMEGVTTISSNAPRSGSKPTATSSTTTSAPPQKKAKPGRRGSTAGPKTPADKDTSNNPQNSPAPAQDVHPYARGAVIEVLYIPAQAVGKTTASIQAATSNDPWYWSEDSSLCSTTSSSSAENDEDDDEGGSHANKTKDGDVAMEDVNEIATPQKDNTPKDDKTTPQEKDSKQAKKTPSPSSSKDNKEHHHHHHHHHQNAASVRLCDIIDRAPVVNEDGTEATNAAGQPQFWRYYVHYKDFNRRMDEWVGMDRVVSLPSVGNAKARALKKEEEKQKRKQQRLEEKQRAEQQKKEQKILGDVDVTAPRSSRRRASAQTTSAAGASLTSAAGSLSPAAGVAGGAGAAGTDAAGRKTRLRRKSMNADDDAATVVAGNQDEAAAGNHDANAPAAIKEILTLPAGTSTMATTTVGEHVVATVAAQELDEHEGLDEASLREHEEITKVKNVSFIELGRHQMETWYFSPIPKELLSDRGYIEILYICEFTFRMFARKCELQRFQQRSLKPQDRHPPGNEIYRKDNLSMFEVDGLTERIYCQNLSYIAKLFLDHKTLYFDVDPFLFYVLCEVDERGYHPVGYYSKEKYSDVGYNLACILTFPAQQRKGYGRFLIAFSYELSKKQEKVGGPERPVSDLGQKAYKPFWAATVVDFLRNCENERDSEGNIMSSSLSIMDISKKTSVMAEDIVFALNQLGILKIINGVYFIAAEKELLEKLAKKWPVKEPRVDPSRLHWTPFLTDIKRDKFSIHSKKPNVEGIATAVQQQATPAAQQQQGQAQ